jgi:hypothetical protein
MAARSEIKIDIDSAEFVAFADKFQKYAELLKTVPDTWKNVAKTTAVSKTNFEAAADAVAVTAGSMAAIQKSTNEFYHVTTSVSRHWKDLAHHRRAHDCAVHSNIIFALCPFIGHRWPREHRHGGGSKY